jgi:SAM-dependent methyltransferase
MPGSRLHRRAERALVRQLDYQRRKAAAIRGREDAVMLGMEARSRALRERLDAFRPISESDRVIEVGSGAHGLCFFFGTRDPVGVDPLADHYAALFPAWQRRALTVAARGESLPFRDASFDVVLCDNVVDHAENPRRIIEEIVRLMRPGGILYFEVNVHHPIYRLASAAHSGWQALGFGPELGPFADHTYHLTAGDARRLFDRLPLGIEHQGDDIAATRQRAWSASLRRPSDMLKLAFFKNARFEVIAIRR